MKSRLLHILIIITAFLCASALPVHFMSSGTETVSFSETTLTTQKQTVREDTTTTVADNATFKGITDTDFLINSIVMVDPDAFTSPKKADPNQLFKIAFWCVLHSDGAANYNFSLRQMTVSRKKAEKMYSSLFPGAKASEPCDMNFNGVLFTYDKSADCYRVPVTGITSHYTGKTVKENQKSDNQIFEIQYIPDSKWKQDSNGKIIPPKPEKTMLITLKKHKDSTLSILSVTKK